MITPLDSGMFYCPYVPLTISYASPHEEDHLSVICRSDEKIELFFYEKGVTLGVNKVLSFDEAYEEMMKYTAKRTERSYEIFGTRIL